MGAIPLILASAAAALLFADRKSSEARVIDATPSVRVKVAPKALPSSTQPKPKPKQYPGPKGKGIVAPLPKGKVSEANAAKQAAVQAAKLEVKIGTAKIKPAPSIKTQAKGSQLSSQLRQLSPAKPAPSNKRKAPPGTNIPLAAKTAADVAKHIRNAGRKYNRKALQQFQTRAGLKPDGFYGPITADALRYFGAAAPKPLFNVNSPAHYVPPTV